MTCNDVQERDLAERYLLGHLDDAEREAFELHYFACARCYSNVQALGAVRDALAHQPVRPRAGRRIWLSVAAALVLAVSGAVAWRTLTPAYRPPPAAATGSDAAARLRTRADEIARLALVTPPPYEPSRFRGDGDREAFTSGMRHYGSADFGRAIPLLRRALDAAPPAEDARFYLGASQLLNGQPEEAVATLKPLAATTRSPYAEEAQFLIAKAHLRFADLPAAAADLEKIIAMHGDREAEARALRTRISELDAAR